MIKNQNNKRSKNIILLVLGGIFLLFPFTLVVAAMYNGSPNWHPPKKVICKGIPNFPSGIEVQTYPDQVFGASFDMYIFTEMVGAMGIYYFQLKLQDPADSNQLYGTVTYLDSIDWKPIESEVNCVVKEWH